jgi:hypothetical protein
VESFLNLLLHLLSNLELIDIAYSELILLIDAKTNSGKSAFNKVEGRMIKGHLPGNAASA